MDHSSWKAPESTPRFGLSFYRKGFEGLLLGQVDVRALEFTLGLLVFPLLGLALGTF